MGTTTALDLLQTLLASNRPACPLKFLIFPAGLGTGDTAISELDLDYGKRYPVRPLYLHCSSAHAAVLQRLWAPPHMPVRAA